MILDKNLMFSEAQDLLQTNATYNSTNILDLGAAPTVPGGLVGTVPIDPGRGHDIRFRAWVTTTFTTSASATLRVELVQSAATNLGTPTILPGFDTGVLAITNLTANSIFKLPEVVSPLKTPLRYMGVLWIIGTGATTAGNASAGLLLDTQTNTLPTQIV